MPTLKTGDRVRALGACRKTREEFGFTPRMREQIKKRTIITVFEVSGDHVLADTTPEYPYMWHPADLKKVVPRRTK